MGVDLERLYRNDIEYLPKEINIDNAILDKAREGDKAAQEVIIYSLLSIIIAYATRLQNKYTRIIDLVSTGNTILVEKMDAALKHPNPCGYLLKFAKGEMLHYSERGWCLITMPTGPGWEPYKMTDIVQEFGDEFEIEEKPTSIEQFADNTPLYNSLEALPNEQAKDIIVRLYGLFDQQEETIGDVAGGNSTTKSYQAIKTRKLNYLKTTRQFMEKYHPVFVHQHTRETTKNAPRYADVQIPEVTRKKLNDARKVIQERGEKLSMNKLRIESGVHTTYASAYLYQLQRTTSNE